MPDARRPVQLTEINAAERGPCQIVGYSIQGRQMTDATPDQLRAMAAWQARWAELAGSDEERQRRRRFADYLERLANEREAKSALILQSAGAEFRVIGTSL
jgi:hypothetical protein